MDKVEWALDGVLIQRIMRDEDSYIGSNAFGAKVEVRRTYAEEYSVEFRQDNWLFRASQGDSRTFTYRLAMTPDEARTMKADAKLVLVCRLTPPWLRHSAHGHDATINEPYETLIGDNYLQAEAEQLWILNQRNGEVIRKLSGLSTAGESNEQKPRHTPLLLEVSPASVSSIKIAIDDGTERSDVLGGTKTFAATRKIVLILEFPISLSDITLKLNGKPYAPNWSTDATRIGSSEVFLIRSATAVITAP
jgi:hypothetical protein